MPGDICHNNTEGVKKTGSSWKGATTLCAVLHAARRARHEAKRRGTRAPIPDSRFPSPALFFVLFVSSW
jgi:hypothetical protein